MRRDLGIGWIGLVILFGLISVTAYSDGLIIPDEPSWGWLSIVYHHVEVSIQDGVVTTHVDQLFRNDTTRSMEGRYVFPLPPGAVVSDFAMWVDDEKLEAKVLPAEEAREIYEGYVRRALDPALLEYVGRDTLAARIFPVPPGEERRIALTYTEILQVDQGLYRYRYPLDTERFSARPLESVRVAVELETNTPLKAIYSPSHPLYIQRQDERLASAVYEERNVLPSEDFFLYYSVSQEEMGMTLLTYRVPEEDGFFLLVLSPRVEISSTAAIPKDIVFVLDQSGSMYGEKIAQAKEALDFILQNLNPEDRFAVVSFSDAVEACTSGPVTVTSESVSGALAWVERVEAGGGTNIDAALTTAFSLFDLDEETRARFVIFLTDGEATVGAIEPLTIIQNAKEANGTQARLFIFGVGYDVNTFLLDRLAQENHGTTMYVAPGENLEARLVSFYSKIASPVLSSPYLKVDSVGIFDVYPAALPDLFRGSQLLVLGRYRGSGEAQIDLGGETEEGSNRFTYAGSFLEIDLEDSFLPRLWAGRKIAYLLDQIRLYGESDELIDSVIRLSTRYGIITPYTSFLVEEGRQYSAEEMRSAVGAATSAPATGKQAVLGSSSLRTLAEGETVQQSGTAVRYVEDRTFFLRDGVWVESSYQDEPTIDIAAFSSAYFELLDIIPEVAPYLALGDRLVVKVGDRYLRIGEGGLEELTDPVIGLLTG